MWQDALALFIVLIAALAALRIFLPAGLFQFGAGHCGADASVRGGSNTASLGGGCGGCAMGSACAKTQIKAEPTTSQRHGGSLSGERRAGTR
ncbi:MAG: hypothetical protein IAF00_09745 [Phycisphaerales bacterium]|nr:hypothetical protein [Phycisphaerales bacterium]